jgi:hypothetical protein
LDLPSVTVVVRTNREVDHLPQFQYLPPSIAFDILQPGPIIKRRVQLMRMMAMSGRFDELEELLGHAFGSMDSYTVFSLLRGVYSAFPDVVARDRVMAAATVKHRLLIEACAPALEADARRDLIAALRERVGNPDLQFFLALLLNIPNRETIISLIRTRYHIQDASSRIVGWTRELSALGVLGRTISESSLEVMRRSFNSGAADGPVDREMAGRDEVISDSMREFWLTKPLFVCGHRHKISVV